MGGEWMVYGTIHYPPTRSTSNYGPGESKAFFVVAIDHHHLIPIFLTDSLQHTLGLYNLLLFDGCIAHREADFYELNLLPYSIFSNWGMYCISAPRLRVCKKSETLLPFFETSSSIVLCYACCIRRQRTQSSTAAPGHIAFRACCDLVPSNVTATGTRRLNMSHHRIIHNRPVEPQMERMIRLCLRALGVFALAVCIVFWLSLLLR